MVDFCGFILCDIMDCSVEMICVVIGIGFVDSCGIVVWLLVLVILILKILKLVIMGLGFIVNILIGIFGILCRLNIVLIGKCWKSFFFIIICLFFLFFFVGWKIKWIVLLNDWVFERYCVVFNSMVVWLLWL